MSSTRCRASPTTSRRRWPSPRCDAGGVRRPAAVIIAGMLALGLSACADKHVESFTVSEPVTKLVLDVGAGNVTIAGTNDQGLSGRRIIHQRGKKPTLSQSTKDGVLTIRSRCSGGLFRSCRLDQELTVPRHLPVEVRSGSGNVTVKDVQDTIDVRTESGSVRLTQPGGRVTAHTGSGSVDIDRASDDLALEGGWGPTSAPRLITGIVKATTGSGRIAVGFDEAPDSVEVTTGSGSISVKVPQQAY